MRGWEQKSMAFVPSLFGLSYPSVRSAPQKQGYAHIRVIHISRLSGALERQRDFQRKSKQRRCRPGQSPRPHAPLGPVEDRGVKSRRLPKVSLLECLSGALERQRDFQRKSKQRRCRPGRSSRPHAPLGPVGDRGVKSRPLNLLLTPTI